LTEQEREAISDMGQAVRRNAEGWELMKYSRKKGLNAKRMELFARLDELGFERD